LTITACGAPTAVDALGAPSGGEVRAVALVGASASADEAVILDIAASVHELDRVVLLGDAVRRSSRAEWSRFEERWKPVRDVASWLLVGSGETRGDRRRRALGGARGFADLPLGAAVTLVALETHRARMGDGWAEQHFWLPQALARRQAVIL